MDWEITMQMLFFGMDLPVSAIFWHREQSLVSQWCPGGLTQAVILLRINCLSREAQNRNNWYHSFKKNVFSRPLFFKVSVHLLPCVPCLHIEGIHDRDNMCPLSPSTSCFINEAKAAEWAEFLLRFHVKVSCCYCCNFLLFKHIWSNGVWFWFESLWASENTQ